MHETIRFGHIAGVKVGANWSVLFIAWLLAFGLAEGSLPELAPGYASGVYWVVAIAAALVFFASLLAHEMAHALMARSIGLPVEGIVLWALGGVSRLGGDAPTARDELRIAVAGPATSLAIGAATFVVTVALGEFGAPDLLVAAMAWLATINVVLGLFNLAPAFPLDGGRVVRAILWARTGNRLEATRRAAAVGRIVGYGLIGGGAALFMFGGLFQGLWFALIGWFVISLATAETAQVEQRQLLAGVTVSDVMSPEPLCAPADIDVATFLDRYVLTHRYSSYPVVDGAHRLVGLVTLDAVRRVPPGRRPTTSLGEAATPADEVLQVAPDTLLTDVLAGLSATPLGRLVVIDGVGRVVGLVSHTDVVSCLHRRSVAGPGHPPTP